MKKLSIALVLAALALTPALAQVKIDKSVTATADGEVGIENPFGPVTVIGWDRNEVRVTGTMAAGADGIEVDSEEPDEGNRGEVRVSVEVPDSWFYEADTGRSTAIYARRLRGETTDRRIQNTATIAEFFKTLVAEGWEIVCVRLPLAGELLAVEEEALASRHFAALCASISGAHAANCTAFECVRYHN